MDSEARVQILNEVVYGLLMALEKAWIHLSSSLAIVKS